MSFYALAALVNFFTTLALGAIVLIRNPRNKLNLYFSIFSVDVALWSLCYFIWQISTSENQALFWSKALMVFAIFIPATYFHFVATMLGIVKKVRYVLWLSYGVFTFFLMANIFTPLFVASVKLTPPFLYWPVAGPLFSIFLLIWIGHVIYDNYLLYIAHKHASGMTKLQIKYILLGQVFAFSGGSTNYFLWFGVPILPLGNILVSVYVALTAYAIIKHRFLDIRLVVARSVSYSLLVLVLGSFYAGGLVVVGAFIVKQPTNSVNLMTSTILALIIAFTFQPLLRFFEKITDHVFFKSHYDSGQLLKELGKIMASSLDLNNLVLSLLQTLNMRMKVNYTTVVLVNDVGVIWEKTVGDTKLVVLDKQELTKLINEIGPHENEEEKVLLFEEIEESPTKNIMRQYNLSLVLPLIVERQLVGAILFSDKSSGDIYSEEDVNVLKILASEASVAVRNALSYEEIKRFNITLKKEVDRATNDLKTANVKLQELDKLKDDFVSIASHELRTPMTAIKSYLWMAINRPDVPLSEKMTRYTSRAYVSTERLINLVNDMLNVSRIESGRIEVKPQPFDIQFLVNDVLMEVGPKATEKNLQIHSLNTQIPKIFADQDKVHQVLLNLIGNAMKFTPVDGSISINYFTDGKIVETAISDSGVGISKDDLAHLFEKFGRLDNSYIAAATTGGTGLGLYISKSLVTLMQGKMWVTSKGLGKGATFIFSLPVATAEVLTEAEKYTTRVVAGKVKGLEPASI